MPEMDHRDQIHDQLLVMRCREADAGALDELLDRWQERLWRHAVRLTGDSEAAWDILQETMIAVSRRIADLGDPAAFSAWAYKIATNQCRDYFRRQQRRRRLTEAYTDQRPTDTERDHASVMDLQAAMTQLTGPQQTLLSLRYEEGFGVAEIADVLGIHEGTVKSRLFTARQQLRTLLEEHER
ncbi:MAG: sigma-70 family RNA polymerase sigma factor [bacterium]|nr:sigma-70 family RNA polymerase sigma factor [bacterium]